MIDFEEELKRFAPAPEVDQTAETVIGRDMTDLTDLLLQITSQNGGGRA